MIDTVRIYLTSPDHVSTSIIFIIYQYITQILMFTSMNVAMYPAKTTHDSEMFIRSIA